MKQKPFENDREFMRSLDSRQYAYFLKRETKNASRLQAALLDLGRGVSIVSAMNGEAFHNVLTEQA